MSENFSLKELMILAQRMEEIKKIREAIARASSLEEVERLNQLLQAGQIPGNMVDKNSHSGILSFLFFMIKFVDIL